MGLLLSVVIAYAGVNEALECYRHIVNGMIPEGDPDFQNLIDYYTRLLQKSKSANLSSPVDWVKEGGQGYLCLTEDENGILKSAAIKFYDEQEHTTALLFSTKISSFGQESVENHESQLNGDNRSERYTPSRTKTIITNASESFSIGYKNRSPTPSYENISDPNRFSENSFERNEHHEEDKNEAKEKLTWHYRPLSPAPQALPEINLQSFDGEKDNEAYSEGFLRSLDGIKYRPLQRSDPSGRRRSFKKRHSSSSNSSKDSRASREEELKIFTSLEEAEFERMAKDDNTGGLGSTSNLSPRSYSRSRSRENSKEKRNETWSMDGSFDAAPDENNIELKPSLREITKFDSFREEKEETKETKEVNEDGGEEIDDFWGNSDDAW